MGMGKRTIKPGKRRKNNRTRKRFQRVRTLVGGSGFISTMEEKGLSLQNTPETDAHGKWLDQVRGEMETFMKSKVIKPATFDILKQNYNISSINYSSPGDYAAIWKEMGMMSLENISSFRQELEAELTRISNSEPQKPTNSPPVSPDLAPILESFDKAFQGKFTLDPGPEPSSEGPVEDKSNDRLLRELRDKLHDQELLRETKVSHRQLLVDQLEVDQLEAYTNRKPEHQAALKNYMTYELTKLDTNKEEYKRHAKYLKREEVYKQCKVDLENRLERLEKGLGGPGIIDNGRQMMEVIKTWVESNEVTYKMKMKMTEFDMNSLSRMIILTPEESRDKAFASELQAGTPMGKLLAAKQEADAKADEMDERGVKAVKARDKAFASELQAAGTPTGKLLATKRMAEEALGMSGGMGYSVADVIQQEEDIANQIKNENRDLTMEERQSYYDTQLTSSGS